MPRRNISLTPEQDAFIDAMLKAGVYRNASEAIRALEITQNWSFGLGRQV